MVTSANASGALVPMAVTIPTTTPLSAAEEVCAKVGAVERNRAASEASRMQAIVRLVAAGSNEG